jgi:hypothetical protein
MYDLKQQDMQLMQDAGCRNGKPLLNFTALQARLTWIIVKLQSSPHPVFKETKVNRTAKP